jgi:hypothetical protein
MYTASMEVRRANADERTTVGPLEPEVRDGLAAYRDRYDHPNYNSALLALLTSAGKGGDSSR